MQVFKVFFKILRENIPSLLIYFIMTFFCAILFVKVGVEQVKTNVEIKPSIAIVNQSDSEYAKGLVDYLDEKCNVATIEEDLIEDALFYRQISYVLYIPSDFESQLLSGKQVALNVKSVVDAADSYLAKQYVESYLSTIQNNIKYSGSQDSEKLIKMTQTDLGNDVQTTLLNKKGKETVNHYLNFLSYTFCCCLIGGIGYAMSVFNRREIRRRNVVSPLSSMHMSMQQVLAFILYALLLGVVSIVFAYLVFPAGMSESFAPYMVLNTFVTLVPALGLAYLIGTFVPSLQIQTGLSNVLCLILAFLGGSFVPQKYLSESLLRVGTFTPNYWFVKANNALYNLQIFDFEHLKEIYMYMGIQILFGIAFILIALIYAKQRRNNVV
ncbi:MAG: ABC transporter permease [Erysipelotrichia bacterium]|nr:ABC transporter permease [Erysipelotrichia bacterium]NCC55178.1 ABC transporter permease [Erysipelotrichia bacterium]